MSCGCILLSHILLNQIFPVAFSWSIFIFSKPYPSGRILLATVGFSRITSSKLFQSIYPLPGVSFALFLLSYLDWSHFSCFVLLVVSFRLWHLLSSFLLDWILSGCIFLNGFYLSGSKIIFRALSAELHLVCCQNIIFWDCANYVDRQRRLGLVRRDRSGSGSGIGRQNRTCLVYLIGQPRPEGWNTNKTCLVGQRIKKETGYVCFIRSIDESIGWNLNWTRTLINRKKFGCDWSLIKDRTRSSIDLSFGKKSWLSVWFVGRLQGRDLFFDCRKMCWNANRTCLVYLIGQTRVEVARSQIRLVLNWSIGENLDVICRLRSRLVLRLDRTLYKPVCKRVLFFDWSLGRKVNWVLLRDRKTCFWLISWLESVQKGCGGKAVRGPFATGFFFR